MANKKATSFELIKKRLFDEDGDLVELSDLQMNMMERWNYAIELRTCDQLYTKDIVMKLMERFAIERATALNDIGSAEALFGYSTPINKRFRIGARIDYLEEKIALAYEAYEWKAAAMMEATLQKYYEQYPELKKQDAPRRLRFTYSPGVDEKLIEDLPAIQDAEVILTENVNG